MIVGRIIGWIVFIAALPVLATDVLLWLESGYWAPIALGQLWYNLSPSSLYLTQAVVENLSVYAWDPVMTTILRCWAYLALMTLGILMMMCFRERRRPAFLRFTSREAAIGSRPTSRSAPILLTNRG
jgi:hypothetical protein